MGNEKYLFLENEKGEEARFCEGGETQSTTM